MFCFFFTSVYFSFLFFFFFSSRRRHTRCLSDWSSDVCSSDLHSFPLELVFKFLTNATVEEVLTQAMLPAPMFEVRWPWDTSRALAVLRVARSEERRVGKECRARWWRDH